MPDPTVTRSVLVAHAPDFNGGLRTRYTICDSGRAYAGTYDPVEALSRLPRLLSVQAVVRGAR